MRRVDFFCSERHYVDHLLPVYVALPERLRGEFHVGSVPVNPDGLNVVCSVGDYRKTSGPVIFFEHGSGMSYNVNHPSFAGSGERDRVVLFCSPNQFVAGPNARAFPDVPQEVVGSPKLDAWVRRSWAMPGRPTVAFSFHWDSQVCPETRSAWPHYQQYFINQANQHRRSRSGEWDMIGHGHPKIFPQLRKQWSKFRMPAVKEFNDVVLLSDVYVCDNSSTIYEFAALGRPVVVLNAPWYRRDVRQGEGLRFWDHIPGIQVDNPAELHETIRSACFEDTFAAERERVTSLVYPHLGDSASRAAAAIVQLLS
jgi:hypothetical protein